MTESERDDARSRVAEAELVRRIRAEREAAMTPSERLARVDALCRQLAAIRPVREPRD